MKITSKNDMIGTWAIKQYVKKDGTMKVHKKPRGLKFIFTEDGRADMKVVFFTFHVSWELKEDKLIIHPATQGKPPIEMSITENGLTWCNPQGQKTWFAKVNQ